VRPELWSAADGYNLPEELLYPAGLVEVRYLTDDSDDEGGGGGGDGGQPYWAMSQRGAAFVLEELSAQAWHILQVYIGDDERKLEFLLELAHMHFGQAYPLDDAQRGLIGELHHLGIVHVRDPGKSKAFYPTRLAAAIVSAGDLSPGAQVQGRTIVESNMRVYVYTQSRAWVEILRLFLRLRTLLPNAIVASITRATVQNAIREHGLSAEAIISFLSRNAHEQVKSRPLEERDKASTVYDQIRLWERELERYTAKPAYYLSDFETHDLFDAEVAHARATGTHMWHKRDAANSRSCKLVLLESEQTVAETRARIKAYKQSHGLS
jgi:transcription initiation factor TFIIH subunit 4